MRMGPPPDAAFDGADRIDAQAGPLRQLLLAEPGLVPEPPQHQADSAVMLAGSHAIKNGTCAAHKNSAIVREPYGNEPAGVPGCEAMTSTDLAAADWMAARDVAALT